MASASGLLCPFARLPTRTGVVTRTSSFNALAEHLIVPLDALNVVGILQQDCPCQLQQRRGRDGGRTAKIEHGAFQLRDDLRIGIVHPRGIERGRFPAPRDDRFDVVPSRRDHGEEDPSAITARLIAEHFQKPIVACGQVAPCPRQDRQRPRFLFGHRREQLMKESVCHGGPLATWRDCLT
jgi:hypothetical protein